MLQKIIIFLCFGCISSLQLGAQAFQWARQFAADYSLGTDIVTDNNFNVISSGWFRDSVDLDPGPNNHWVYENSNLSNYNSYLSKLDANGTFVWGYSYENVDTSSYTRIYAIDVDSQDNIIVMGQYRDSIDLDFGVGIFMLYDLNQSNAFWDNIFIAKYDPNGSLIWGKGLHSSSTGNYGLWGHGLKVDGNNDVVLSGRYHDTVDFDPGPNVYNLVSNGVTSANYGNKFLLKLSAAGNFIWVRDWDHTGNWNNTGWWGSNELDVDGNNNIFLPIVYIDSMDIDPGLAISMIHSNGLRDVSLLKMSSAGNLVWHKEIGGTDNDYCHSLATDPSGNIFYSIRVNGSAPVDFNPGPGVFMLNWTNNNWGKGILKLDNNGSFLWALKNLDNNWGGWIGEGIATDTAGSLYLTTRIHTGWNNNIFDLNPGPNAYLVSSSGLYDIAFQNLDGNGNFIWGGVMGGSGHDWANHVCTDKARGVYMTGYFNSVADFDPTPDTSYMASTPTTYDAFVVKLNNCNVTKSVVYQSCDSVLYNNQYYYSDTILQSHYPAWNGCDSAHTVVIDVQTLSHDTLQVDTCTLYIWNNISYTSSGMYTHNYGLPGGCDSIITLDLTIRYKSAETINIDLCDTLTINGITYTTPGSYNQLLTNVGGCDSLLSINLTPVTLDTSITVNGSANLTSNAVSVTYQWIDCSTNLPIPGETNVFFNATQSGSYACVLTQNGCSDTSSCYNLTVHPDAVSNHQLLSRLYPNPSKRSYYLELNKSYNDVQLEVRTISGQLIWKKNFDQLKETTIKLDQPSGVYMLYIKQGEHTEIKKLLKW